MAKAPNLRSKTAATFPLKHPGAWLVIALLFTGMMMKRVNHSMSGVKPAPFHLPSGPDTRFRGNVVAQQVKNRELGLDITAETSVPNWCGEKMDNDMAVLGLLQLE